MNNHGFNSLQIADFTPKWVWYVAAILIGAGLSLGSYALCLMLGE